MNGKPQKPFVMKTAIKITAMLFFLTFIIGCQKENSESLNESIELVNYKGEKHSAIEVEIHHYGPDQTGNCEGFFITPINKSFDFMIEIESGIPDELKASGDFQNRHYMIDFEFTGSHYACNQQYKTSGPGNDNHLHPFEVQRMKITKMEPMAIN